MRGKTMTSVRVTTVWAAMCVGVVGGGQLAAGEVGDGDWLCVGSGGAVGTVSAHLVDATREEPHTEDADDVRELMVQFWYPADVNGGAGTAYFPAGEAGAAMRRRFAKGEAGLENLATLGTPAMAGAAARGGERWPLVVFSHGFSDWRGNNQSQAMALASRGYVVAAIDHTYSAYAVEFPDGRVAKYQGSLKQAGFPLEGNQEVKAIFDLWVGDVEFLMSSLEGAEGDDALARMAAGIDFERVGILGHSFGGSVAADRCSRAGRFRAGLNLDGSVKYGAVGRGLRTPFLTLSSRSAEGAAGGGVEWSLRMGGFRRLAASRPEEAFVISIRGMDHMNFSDWPLVVAACADTEAPESLGSIDARRGATILNRCVADFFDTTLKGREPEYLRADGAFEEEVVVEAAPWVTDG